MIRLAYIFWAAALFMVGACSKQQTMVYRPDVCHYETATASPAGLVFDPPALAVYSGEGYSEVAGVQLNSRPSIEASNGWSDDTAGMYYQLRYYDRHPSLRANDGYLDRSFLYYRQGTKVR